MNPAVRQLLLGGGGPSLRSVSNSSPLYASHRGNSYLAPENTLAAYENAMGWGESVLECDVHLLSDGGLAVMHDTTVDRTTTGTGAVSSFSSATWKALAIDAAAQNVPGWGDAVSPPLFQELLSAHRRRAIFSPEVKASTAKQSIVDALQAAGVRKDQALIQSFTLADLAPAQTAGYSGCLLLSVASAALSANITAAQAAGVTWCGIDEAAPDSSFSLWVDAGFKVMAYTVNRRARRDQLLALGVVGFFTDDAPYLSGRYRTASSNYALGKWSPGMFSMNTSTTAQNRGSINAGGWFGWADPAFVADIYRGTLQGWMGQLNLPTYAVSFEARINAVNADNTRWGAVFISDAAMKDNLYTNTNNVAQTGYNLLFRKNGTLEIFITGGGATTSIASSVNAGMAMADGVSNFFKITVTPTNLRLARTDSSGNELQACNVNNSTYRGGYLHLGRDGALAEFRGVTVN